MNTKFSQNIRLFEGLKKNNRLGKDLFMKIFSNGPKAVASSTWIAPGSKSTTSASTPSTYTSTKCCQLRRIMSLFSHHSLRLWQASTWNIARLGHLYLTLVQFAFLMKTLFSRLTRLTYSHLSYLFKFNRLWGWYLSKIYKNLYNLFQFSFRKLLTLCFWWILLFWIGHFVMLKNYGTKVAWLKELFLTTRT